MDIAKRPVSMSDSELILAWRNCPSSQKASQIEKEVSADEHKTWFSSRVERIKFEPFWIMSRGEEETGYVRLDRLENGSNVFTLSIYVVPQSRGMGVGRVMLRVALEAAVKDYAASHFRAIIKKSNQASIKLFEFFGFECAGEIDEKFSEYVLATNKIKLNAFNF